MIISMVKGIDVSHWQGTIDWKKVKEDGVKFAILKAGGSDNGFYTDGMYSRNYEACKDNHIPVGIYYFLRDKFYINPLAEAAHIIELIRSKTFELPVFIDFEPSIVYSKAENTKALNHIICALDLMDVTPAVGIYASDISGFQNSMNLYGLTPCVKWVARYGKQPSCVTDWQIWQMSGSGTCPGINGAVDIDYMQDEYYEKMVGPVDNIIRNVAMDVLAGKYGNGPARKASLEAAGYNYNEVQAEVNKILRGE